VPERAAARPAAMPRGGPSGGRGHDLLVGLAAALSITVFVRAPWTFFAADDIVHLSRAAGFLPWNGPYRPLTERLAYWIQFRLFGLDPIGYHLVNMSLHLACVAGVYALGLRLTGSKGRAFATAVLFGCASIAFTPLYWASGVIELATCALLLAATLAHLAAARRGPSWRWLAALLGLGAMLSKETALAWPLWIAWIEWRADTPGTTPRARLRALLPSAAAAATFLAALAAYGHFVRLRDSAAYAIDPSVGTVLLNLLTYLGWATARWEAIPDRVAAIDPGAWPIGLALLAASLLVLRVVPAAARRVAAAGMGASSSAKST